MLRWIWLGLYGVCGMLFGDGSGVCVGRVIGLRGVV
jgi:hypothetical protein